MKPGRGIVTDDSSLKRSRDGPECRAVARRNLPLALPACRLRLARHQEKLLRLIIDPGTNVALVTEQIREGDFGQHLVDDELHGAPQ